MRNKFYHCTSGRGLFDPDYCQEDICYWRPGCTTFVLSDFNTITVTLEKENGSRTRGNLHQPQFPITKYLVTNPKNIRHRA